MSTCPAYCHSSNYLISNAKKGTDCSDQPSWAPIHCWNSLYAISGGWLSHRPRTSTWSKHETSRPSLTVWIIRKFSLISSWNLPPYNPTTHWIWVCLLDLQENEFTSLFTCHPLKLPTYRQLPCLFQAILSGTRCQDTCLVLLLKVVKKWQTGVGRLTQILNVSFWASTSTEIMLLVPTLPWLARLIETKWATQRGFWSGTTCPTQHRPQRPLQIRSVDDLLNKRHYRPYGTILILPSHCFS